MGIGVEGGVPGRGSHALRANEAISANTIARTIGSSVGTAVIAAIITSHTTVQGVPTDDAFSVGFWACAVVAVLAILAAVAAPSLAKRREQAAALGIDDLPDPERTLEQVR